MLYKHKSNLAIAAVFLSLALASYTIKTNADKESYTKESVYAAGVYKDLRAMHKDYLKASQEQRVIMQAIAYQRFGVFKIDNLPPDLKEFYDLINKEKP